MSKLRQDEGFFKDRHRPALPQQAGSVFCHVTRFDLNTETSLKRTEDTLRVLVVLMRTELNPALWACLSHLWVLVAGLIPALLLDPAASVAEGQQVGERRRRPEDTLGG